MELPADEPPGTPWSDRGMAYHFFDGTSWVSNPDYQDANNIARVDAARTGFGAIGRLGNKAFHPINKKDNRW